MNKEEILEALNHIPVSSVSYQDWLAVGMALKYEGFDCSAWDDWSKNDERYHNGECERKWAGFNGSSNPVTGATIVKLAKENGYRYINHDTSRCLDWNDAINEDDNHKTDYSKLKPTEQLAIYLKTLFKPDEYVGYCTNDAFKDSKTGKWLPTRGVYCDTAGYLIHQLEKHPDDLGATIGDWKKEAGAWIRFNPLDGKGVKKGNVTRFSYCLVECDDMPVAKQEEIYRTLNIPIAALVYSGSRSLHAIVKIDANNIDEYQERVGFCYDFLKNNGLKVDEGTKDPNRFSRMPGVTRNGVVQSLIDINIGYDSWHDWMVSLGKSDDFVIDNIAKLVLDPPPLSPELIHGFLRRGHKFLLSGASKSGKSFMLAQLAICLSEGMDWVGFKCEKSRVCYLNFEIERASSIRRFVDLYVALHISRPTENLIALNLRGKAKPLTALVPMLIDEFKDKDIDVFIIDPIYKIITGDENNATEMALFCNQFDIICDKLHATVIYAHHHSKGAQGGKTAQDRASGSGVFARDPDALMDMIELDIDEDTKNRIAEKPTDTAWQLECVTREFPKPRTRKVWFRHPLHILADDELRNFYPKGDIKNAQKSSPNYSEPEDRKWKLDNAFDTAAMGANTIHINDVMKVFSGSEKTLRSYIKEFSNEYSIRNGIITKNKESK